MKDLTRLRIFCVALPLVLVAGACDPLGGLTADGRCGNLILEPASGEDCDGYAAAGSQCGDNSSAAACRFQCGLVIDNRPDAGMGATRTVVCPGSFKCGLDGICRASANRFDPPQALPITGGELHLGDINGDLRTDFIMVEQDGVGVYLGGLRGGFARTAATTADTGRVSLSLGPLRGGPGVDAALVVNDGFIHALGDSSGELLPVVYPFKSIAGGAGLQLLAVRAAPPYDHDALLQITAGMGPTLAAEVVSHEVTLPRNLVDASALPMLGRTPGFIVSSSAADIDAAPRAGARTADEVAIIPSASGTAFILSVECASDAGPCTLRRRGSVAVPAMNPTSTFFADLDGNGTQDLIVGLESGAMAPSSFAVAFGDGAGGFYDRPGGGQRRAQPVQIPALACSSCAGAWAPLLAVADLDADGAPDLITAAGVLYVKSLGAGATEPGPLPMSGNWAEAVARDFNSDGRLDIALLTAGLGGVDLLVATGTRQYNRLFSGTSTAVAHDLRVGDFDGDLALDLALITEAQRISVLYSDAHGLPRMQVLEGDIGGAQSLRTARRGGGLSDELVLASQSMATGGGAPDVHLSALRSRGGQLLQSSIGLGASLVDTVIIGRFISLDRADTLMITHETSLPARSIRVLATANPIASVVPSPTTMLATGCDLLTSSQPAIVVADLAGDAHDELVAVSLTPSPSMGPLQMNHFKVVWGGIGQGAGAPTIACAPLDDLVGNEVPLRTEIVDADRDGRPDLLVTLRGQTTMSVGMGSTRGDDTFAIYFGLAKDDPMGPFERTPHVYVTPTGLRAVTVVSGRIAVIGSTQSWLLSLVKRDLPATPWSASNSLAVGSGTGFSTVSAVDVDGNGLDDLVLGGDTTAVMFQEECDAVQVALGKCTRDTP